MSLPVGSHILKDPEAVARAAAERLIEACGESRSERIAICLSGGSTPKVLYGLLSGPDYATRLPWARIHWFFGDDRAVPWDDPRSNVRMVREAFGHGAPIPPTHLHFIPSDAGPDAGARAYERTLLDFYGAERLDPARPLFDLVLLGLGEDGHTASLFPGTPAAGPRRPRARGRPGAVRPADQPDAAGARLLAARAVSGHRRRQAGAPRPARRGREPARRPCDQHGRRGVAARRGRGRLTPSVVLAGGIAGSSAALSRQEPIPGELWRRDGRTFADGTPGSVTTASASPG